MKALSSLLASLSISCFFLPSSSAQKRLFTIGGTQTQNLSPVSAPAGDMNGDKIPDLWIANSLYSGKDGSLLRSYKAGAGANSVAGGLDLDGDGVLDVVFGLGGSRKVILVSGKTGKILFKWSRRSQTETWGFSVGIQKGKSPKIYSWGSNGYAFFDPKSGRYLQTVRQNLDFFDASKDLDADGEDDLARIYWVPFWTIHYRHFSTKLSKSRTSISYSFGTYLPTEPHNAFFPTDDLDGDGTRDFLFLNPKKKGIFLFSTKTKRVRRLQGLPEKPPFPVQMLGLSDIDQDGIKDYLISNPSTNSVNLYSGRTNQRIYQHRNRGRKRFGLSLALLGDRDGDGTSEFLIYDGDQSQAGRWNLFTYRPWQDKASYISLFEAKGLQGISPPSLRGLGNPFLGTTALFEITAKRSSFGVLLSGLRAHPGDVAPLPGNPIPLYLDKRFLFPFTFSFPIVMDKAKVQIPLPKLDPLFGLDLGFQAILFSSASAGQLTASNLVLANLGTPISFLKGGSLFHQAISFSLPASGNAKDPFGRPQLLLTNDGAAFFLQLEGDKDSALGTVEFRTAPGSPPKGGGFVLGKLSSSTTKFKIRFWVPPGQGSPQHIYILHRGGKKGGLLRIRTFLRE